MHELDESHQKILQRLIAGCPIKEKKLNAICSELLGPDFDTVRSTMNTISEQVSKYSFSILRIVYDNGVPYWGFANRGDDELAKVGSSFKPSAVQTFRRVVEAIVDTTEGEIGTTLLKNLRGDLSTTEMTELIRSLEEDQYLTHGSSASMITLGPRCFIELQQFLRALELPICFICSEDVLRGIPCTKADCAGRIHIHCASSIKQTTGRTFACKNCKTPMDMLQHPSMSQC